jgi:transposase
MQKQDYVAIGIDVSSMKLDAYVLPTNEHQLFENSQKGYKKLANWAKKNHADIVLCENTGGYETPMLLYLFNASINVRAINPKQIKRYIESLGTVAKTDKTDAKRIAMFALERRPEPLQTISEESIRFKEMIVFYRQLVLDRSRLKNQIKQSIDQFVIKKTKAMIKYLDHQIDDVRKELQKFITDNDELKAKQKILESVPGIGTIVSTVLLAELPELGTGSAESICALAGVVPITCQSGVWKGKSRIVGGRGTIRCALYEAVMAAVHRCKDDNVFKQLFHKLTGELKKPFKVAMIAVMHKMLRVVHALIKNEKIWENKIEII